MTWPYCPVQYCKNDSVPSCRPLWIPITSRVNYNDVTTWFSLPWSFLQKLQKFDLAKAADTFPCTCILTLEHVNSVTFPVPTVKWGAGITLVWFTQFSITRSTCELHTFEAWLPLTFVNCSIVSINAVSIFEVFRKHVVVLIMPTLFSPFVSYTLCGSTDLQVRWKRDSLWH